MLQLYNTLTRKIEKFIPLEKGKVRMYVCGPTVYDFLHVGNFRGAIFFNLVRNWLEKSAYQVEYMYNYTDIDDKIIKRANEEKSDVKEISERYIAEFEKDFKALQLKPHEHNPRATESIPAMIDLISRLIKNGKAYVEEGEVYYEINTFKEYGKLSHKKLDELQIGNRIEVDQKKRNPLDFVLWKPSKPSEPFWASPWGKGRPGWHIECTCMIQSILGEQIDIHGGGVDLIFPHHENEIAQGEGATGKPYVNYWMHNNFIKFGDEKMSKSLGNVLTARSFIEKYDPEVLKYMILSVHYRSLLQFDEHQINQAIASLGKIYSALALVDRLTTGQEIKESPEASFHQMLVDADAEIEKALNDDFNTAVVFAKIFEAIRLFNASYRPGTRITPLIRANAKALQGWMKNNGELLALFLQEPETFLKKMDDRLLLIKGLERSLIDQKIVERTEAREAKNYQRSDEIRDELLAMGIDLQDSREGTYWEVRKGDI